MSYHSVVMVKQVPDTANISGQVMKPDGTVNRSKLPTVFNPEDKVALELALQLRDRYGGTVRVVTMGPLKASDLLRDCLYMGADEAFLISDRRFAGADTLATSYVLAAALRKLQPFDIVFAGRQAIDGDTAQVGPQTAEKLGLPQITYAEGILDAAGPKIRIRRKIDQGFEVLEGTLPLLVTVVKDAAAPRPCRAKRVMAFKNARTLLELEKMAEANSLLYVDQLKEEYVSKGLFIETMTADDLDVDLARCGLAGSPTKVHKIDSVILGANEHETIPANKEGMYALIDKLMDDHIFG
ncbi:electron transfer flavoprotein subunit beta/FixA family protein [Thiococcus pfennigii]|jgi:electron transfer flavoprotein beta subunit|uniref:electron transfer flavoprotein subunit beta/FixA family protein n=1 Tax=Thiococcus pfennigii TaxID=1057 RepID=UPI001904304F|nr:electron transfer flavoprotein subunit beta/FixA family protein [Thiococcus pfennigii]MBK1699876.1 electron transfer flavoprotein subunit beta [Thiococcus pfennigii]MBK1732524.1 electron transfer flavoprotein subunit beta [Thiococcus pfennigii]